MKIFIATMLCEDEVANHESPTVILGTSREGLLAKVRSFVKISWWRDAMDIGVTDVDALSIDEMNGKLAIVDEDVPWRKIVVEVAEI